jgi:hypothetical protein
MAFDKTKQCMAPGCTETATMYLPGRPDDHLCDQHTAMVINNVQANIRRKKALVRESKKAIKH